MTRAWGSDNWVKQVWGELRICFHTTNYSLGLATYVQWLVKVQLNEPIISTLHQKNSFHSFRERLTLLEYFRRLKHCNSFNMEWSFKIVLNLIERKTKNLFATGPKECKKWMLVGWRAFDVKLFHRAMCFIADAFHSSSIPPQIWGWTQSKHSIASIKKLYTICVNLTMLLQTTFHCAFSNWRPAKNESRHDSSHFNWSLWNKIL